MGLLHPIASISALYNSFHILSEHLLDWFYHFTLNIHTMSVDSHGFPFSRFSPQHVYDVSFSKYYFSDASFPAIAEFRQFECNKSYFRQLGMISKAGKSRHFRQFDVR